MFFSFLSLWHVSFLISCFAFRATRRETKTQQKKRRKSKEEAELRPANNCAWAIMHVIFLASALTMRLCRRRVRNYYEIKKKMKKCGCCSCSFCCCCCCCCFLCATVQWPALLLLLLLVLWQVHTLYRFSFCVAKNRKSKSKNKKMAKKLLNKRALRVGIFSVVAASATKVGQVDRATMTTRWPWWEGGSRGEVAGNRMSFVNQVKPDDGGGGGCLTWPLTVCKSSHFEPVLIVLYIFYAGCPCAVR